MRPTKRKKVCCRGVAGWSYYFGCIVGVAFVPVCIVACGSPAGTVPSPPGSALAPSFGCSSQQSSQLEELYSATPHNFLNTATSVASDGSGLSQIQPAAAYTAHVPAAGYPGLRKYPMGPACPTPPASQTSTLSIYV